MDTKLRTLGILSKLLVLICIVHEPCMCVVFEDFNTGVDINVREGKNMAAT